jgi:hypothetical protein
VRMVPSTGHETVQAWLPSSVVYCRDEEQIVACLEALCRIPCFQTQTPYTLTDPLDGMSWHVLSPYLPPGSLTPPIRPPWL